MANTDYQALQLSSHLSAGNAEYIEQWYESYLTDPDAVPEAWRQYFDKMGGQQETAPSHAEVKAYFLEHAKRAHGTGSVLSGESAQVKKQAAVDHLVAAYRQHGHLKANINPLYPNEANPPCLQLAHYGLNDADLDGSYIAPQLMGQEHASLRDIFRVLQSSYCQSVGAEYMHIRDENEVRWLQQRLERNHSKTMLSTEEKKHILTLLTAADGLEKYLGAKYVGQKRFSLEGGDCLIPLIDRVIHSAAEQDAQEVAIGMAHRGRLNVLVNIMGQSAGELFDEFEGKKDYGMTSGDVKYHMGFSSDVPGKDQAHPIHLSLTFNPSHLAVITAVVQGSVRARQRRYAQDCETVVPIVVHGDAAFSGQGIVMETLNMSQTRAYHIGGTLHIVVNNQLGFTTSNPHDARSSLYCTDSAKMIDVPVFHVNGDDPEAVAFVAQLAVDYRMRFKKDVLIDLLCYRRHGHNEADEPSATQPLMYQRVKKHESVRALYAHQLIAAGVCDQAFVDKAADDYKTKLDKGERVVNVISGGLSEKYQVHWSTYVGQEWTAPGKTHVAKAELDRLGQRLVHLPEGFKLQRQVGLALDARVKMAAGEQPLDWGFAENLAYATLLEQGHAVRISGQDCERGTFAHRHAVLHDHETGDQYIPLAHLSDDQAQFEIYNSLLSEFGVMAFEYGYAKTDPDNLVIWEAQFGDFANGAQVVIDQFISSAWQKWQRLSGLVLLLPHGYEGMGPEHSSARLERYLQLCAQNNMQVCVPTTPAQIFHLLRRQLVRQFRRPLIVMTPKSLLRHKLAVSRLKDLSEGEFRLVIPEIDTIVPSQVKRVVLCSGKVYYDLLAKRRELDNQSVALIRIEQLYPFPMDPIKEALAQYSQVHDVVWCQEEPKNQGAWFVLRSRFEKCLAESQRLRYVGREASASPAVGYSALHRKQQLALINEALSLL